VTHACVDHHLFIRLAHSQHVTDTRFCPIPTSDKYTTPVVRQGCQTDRAVWAAWTLRYAVNAQASHSPPYILLQDLFSQLFGGGGGGFFGGGGGGGRPSGPRRTKDLVHRINVSLEDLYKGKTTKLALTRNIICSKCDGKGGKEGAVRTCTGCSGRGVRVTLRQMGPMIQQLQSACDECSGTGEVINHKDKCKTCNGRKTISEKKMLEVHVDKGMKGGQTITFHGESDQAPGASPGDVIIEIVEKPHDRFRRQNNDLLAEHEIDLLTALGGGQFSIKHLDERALLVTMVPGEVIKHGS
jgi:DnaJ family protein A protein 2